jgi:hypothetical protein
MEDIEKKMNELKNSFYDTNSKNIFFKNKQKLQCNQTVANNIDLQQVLMVSIYLKEDTNKIIVVYPILKNFVTYTNVNIVIEHLFDQIHIATHQYGNFEMHINMDTYTITAHERFKHMYEILNKMNGDRGNILFNDNLRLVCIYNTPNVLITLQSFFIGISNGNITDRVYMYNKKDTKDLFNKIIS